MKKLLIAAVLFFMVSFAHAQSTFTMYFANNTGLDDSKINVEIIDNTTSTFIYFSQGFIYSYELNEGDNYYIFFSCHDEPNHPTITASLKYIGNTIDYESGTDGAYLTDDLYNGDSMAIQ